MGSLMLPAELQDMASFAVDETDIAVIKESARQQQQQQQQTADSKLASADPAASANGLPASGVPLPAAAAAAASGDSVSPFANGTALGSAAAAAAAPDDSPAGAAGAVAELVSMLSMVSCADMAAGEFTYAAWTQEMADMKVRRWKSLMPVLTPNSELTTREMVSEGFWARCFWEARGFCRGKGGATSACAVLILYVTT
jgi:hypothetical protein